MTIQREDVGNVEYKIEIYRNGKVVTSPEGVTNVKDFVPGVEIFESITSAAMECKLIVQDAAGLIGAMTGSELFKIQVIGTIVDKTYFFRAYNIESRSRYNGVDVFIINCTSEEFMKNESVNVFGHSSVIFSGETESSSIVKKLLQKQFLGTQKKLFLESTINKHEFVVPNWRPFDLIYWLAQRSIRKAKKGGTLQNGFVFYENSLGYHFKSVDKLIADVEDQAKTQQTNFQSGTPKLYKYVHSPLHLDDGATDEFKISAVVFPEERNYLMGLRHGAWSGYSIGFDPVTITESKMGLSTDMSVDAYRYSIKELWKKMEHLNGKRNVSPISQMDTAVQAMIDYPKRVRYTMLPNQTFDPKYKDNPQKNYEELVELQAYQYLRFESFKNIKLQIKVPGNLDLYAGSGIEVVIPANYNANTIQNDKKYSGRYIIAGITHQIANDVLTSELMLVKDSVV